MALHLLGCGLFGGLVVGEDGKGLVGGCGTGGIGLFVVPERVGSHGRLASFDGFLGVTEVGFELGPHLGSGEFCVPGSNVIGKNGGATME